MWNSFRIAATDSALIFGGRRGGGCTRTSRAPSPFAFNHRAARDSHVRLFRRRDNPVCWLFLQFDFHHRCFDSLLLLKMILPF